jgi:DNA helicase-2/ATP-dependent DNA helicase PcrA
MKHLTLDGATVAQRAAIESSAPEILAVAGPGSGKTATLVSRIRRLVLDGVAPEKIVVLTFTNAGANELRERIVDAVKAERDLDSSAEDPEPEELGFAGTLHSFALRMLREHGAAIGYGPRLSLISPESSRDLLAAKARALAGKRPPALSRLLELKTALPGRIVPPGSPERFDLAETIVRAFFAEMRVAGLLDYDMLLDEFLALLEGAAGLEIAAKFTHLFVDEVQDSARIDWRIYRAFPAAAKFLVGDPDQGIYGFRGGRVDEMVGASLSPNVETLALEANFRSRPEICVAAQRLIANNFSRIAKETRSARDRGGRVVLLPAAITDGEEIAIVARTIRDLSINHGSVPFEEIAVLARTNAIADQFRKGLPGAGVPVVTFKRSEFPPDFKLARAFVELCVDPDNDALASFYLIARAEHNGTPPDVARAQVHAARLKATATGKTLNETTLQFTRISQPSILLEALAGFACRETRAIAAEQFQQLPRGAGVLDLALALAQIREFSSEEGEGVRVLTMHGSKGREFDAVFVVGFEDEAIPGRVEGSEIEEERRLAYVAATRAREFLAFSHAQSRSSQWARNAPRTPSRFLAELGLSV